MKLKERFFRAGKEVVSNTKAKFSDAKKDRRLVILLVVEFVLVMVLVGAFLIYLNPAVDLPAPFSASMEARVFIAILITAVVLFLYSYTKDFRIERNEKWLKTKKELIKK